MPSLELRDLSLQARLGCSADERASPQEIRVSAKVQFDDLPSACTTDRIEDTLCYGTLSENLKQVVAGREFRTIEHLAWSCAQAIQEMRSGKLKGKLTVHKIKPPVPGLLGGAIFTMEL